MKVTVDVIVKNPLGLHTRPATEIVKLLTGLKSRVFFTYNGESVDARSIMGILTLAATRGSQITITCDGEDAELAKEQLQAAFKGQFGEIEG